MIKDSTQQGQANEHELTSTQRQNARRLLRQLLKGTCKIGSSLPDTGPLVPIRITPESDRMEYEETRKHKKKPRANAQ
jgi:hypothetical protein